MLAFGVLKQSKAKQVRIMQLLKSRWAPNFEELQVRVNFSLFFLECFIFRPWGKAKN